MGGGGGMMVEIICNYFLNNMYCQSFYFIICLNSFF